MSIFQSIKHQDALLTINTKRDGEIKNALPGVHVSPCYLDADNGVWVIYARFDAGTLLPRHFHTGVVHFFTTAGSWNYVEYPDDVQTAGSYLFEPAGSIHTFSSEQGTEGFMVIEGANINLNDDDSLMFIMDAGWIERTLHAVAQQTGQNMPRYIKPGAEVTYNK
ncbi:2,4'-dihydroxyacetophenone dioxygenase family protein [Acinetobacter venetianus]|uniref:2,4'-dihydroxyacetophenone dioxygenase family protein n=1 Tax=Acinetobacter venetianus TaxID=52133 RepID=UPI001022AF1D|nr:2,4'-dihydroxyacetophenone dioxygenase family protein [Acinetobacter venetianus]RZG81468.1 2,4'-dihydroxyacetophenone dioxygenase [Acinetobacter venetianus]